MTVSIADCGLQTNGSSQAMVVCVVNRRNFSSPGLQEIVTAVTFLLDIWIKHRK